MNFCWRHLRYRFRRSIDIQHNRRRNINHTFFLFLHFTTLFCVYCRTQKGDSQAVVRHFLSPLEPYRTWVRVTKEDTVSEKKNLSVDSLHV